MRRRMQVAQGVVALAVVLGLAWSATAAVKMPRVFGDGMVLQQQMPVPVWGWAKAGEAVTVQFARQEKKATADAAGNWMVRLDSMPAQKEPQELTVTGENTLTFKDVLVGEVWVCSGQSNMAMTVAGCLSFEAEKADAANYPMIRQLKCSAVAVSSPQPDIQAQWSVCTPDRVGAFTAVGYFFARELVRTLDVPVGLISTNWGGTRIEPWTPPVGFQQVPELKDLAATVAAWDPQTPAGMERQAGYIAKMKEWVAQAETARAARQPLPALPEPAVPAPSQSVPTNLYNGMIHPLIPYAIRGALWYQGEANGNEGVTYLQKMQALIGGWRALWGEGDFPFYYVQLTNFTRPTPNRPEGGDGWANIREAQTQALRIPNTGMACIIDIGEANDIHPKNKQDVGKRLALWALAKNYGKKDLVYSGPLYKGFTVEGAKVRIAFDSVGGGLVFGQKKGLDPVTPLNGAKLQWIAIAGEDKLWRWAEAAIDGATLIVSSPDVPKPVAVRYAFTANPEGVQLYNKEGLPAAPFRTDNW